MLDRLLNRLGKRKLKQAAIKLCDAGLLTCTKGKAGDDGAMYALAWKPLDNPEQFSPEVRARHERNMQELTKRGGATALPAPRSSHTRELVKPE